MAYSNAATWGRDRPYKDSAWYEWYHKEIVKWAIGLTAQRFGAVPSDIDYPDKLELGLKLIRTGTQEIEWVNHEHDMFFGMCSCDKHTIHGRHATHTENYDGVVGENMLGKIIMLVRHDLAKNFEGDLDGTLCTHCFIRCKGVEKQGTEAIVYWSNGHLCRYVACQRHVSTVAKHAKRHARNKKVYHRDIKDGKPRKPSQYYDDGFDDDDEGWKNSWAAVGSGAAGSANWSSYTSTKNWNVIVFDPSSDEKMVENVLEAV